MKITKRHLKRIIAEEYGDVVTGREKGMSVSSRPPAGMTGLEVGDMVYLKHDAYLDADIGKFGEDFPPISVMEIAPHKDLLGMNHKTWADGSKGMRYSDYDFAAGVGEELAFVGEYQTAPGMPEESLVFPVSAIDWEYTERGPKEIWQWGGPTEKGTYAGGGVFKEGNEMRITKNELRRIIREEKLRIILESQSYDDKLHPTYEKFVMQGMGPTDSPFYVEYDDEEDPDYPGEGPWWILGDDMLVYGSSDNEAAAEDYAEELNIDFRAHAGRFAKKSGMRSLPEGRRLLEYYGEADPNAISEEAYEAYNSGVRKLGDFVEWLDERGVFPTGMTKAGKRREASGPWRSEKQARKPFKKSWSAWD